MGPELASTEQQVSFWRSIPGILLAEQSNRGNWFSCVKKNGDRFKESRVGSCEWEKLFNVESTVPNGTNERWIMGHCE